MSSNYNGILQVVLFLVKRKSYQSVFELAHESNIFCGKMKKKSKQISFNFAKINFHELAPL